MTGAVTYQGNQRYVWEEPCVLGLWEQQTIFVGELRKGRWPKQGDPTKLLFSANWE